jgi:hypothetical protein
VAGGNARDKGQQAAIKRPAVLASFHMYIEKSQISQDFVGRNRAQFLASLSVFHAGGSPNLAGAVGFAVNIGANSLKQYCSASEKTKY